jgi:hypothetical protein
LRRAIDEFWANAPREAEVGSRHHTAPTFYLRRFASNGQLLVRDRNSGELTTRNVDDLSITLSIRAIQALVSALATLAIAGYTGLIRKIT